MQVLASLAWDLLTRLLKSGLSCMARHQLRTAFFFSKDMGHSLPFWGATSLVSVNGRSLLE